MKHIRIVCLTCRREIDSRLEDERNTREYVDSVTYETCERCKDSPEAKFLQAIFGK